MIIVLMGMLVRLSEAKEKKKTHTRTPSVQGNASRYKR